MRLLLTGGAGYIGAHLVVDLLQAGHEVVVLDDFSLGFRDAVARAQRLAERRCQVIEADVRDRDRVRDALHGVDVVIHLAAYKLVGESMQAPGRYFDNNLGGMASLLHAMEQEGVRRILYSSSAAVYGVQPDAPIREDAVLRSESPYGLSKAMGETMLDWSARLHGWSAVSLRYFNPVGAHPSGRIGQPLKDAAALVPRALMAVAGVAPPLTVFGTDYPTPDGTCLRDYIHVCDLSHAHLVALAALGRPGHHVYNVGTGRPHSVREVIESCARVTGRPVPFTDGARRPGDMVTAVADPTRFQADTGYAATRGLDDMVASAWRWWCDNPYGYADARRSA